MSLLDRFRLDSKTCIVTGGDRGIGYAIAKGFGEVRANVVVANRDETACHDAAGAIADETGAETLAVPTDVTVDDDVTSLVAESVEAFGGVDVLVNNAGITINARAEEMTMAEWQRVIDVNLSGAFRCCSHVGRRMIDDGGGAIINVSSISAFVANYPQPQVSYQASKAGLEGMKNMLASEWAEYGIRVNNINPGYIRTEMIDQILEENQEWGETWFDRMLLEEMATPDDIAPLAVYLASDASSYVTGTSVVIDGGLTVR